MTVRDDTEDVSSAEAPSNINLVKYTVPNVIV